MATNLAVLESGVSELVARPNSRVVGTSPTVDPSSNLLPLPLAVKLKLRPEPNSWRSVPTPIMLTRVRPRCRTRSSRSLLRMSPMLAVMVLPSVRHTMDPIGLLHTLPIPRSTGSLRAVPLATLLLATTTCPSIRVIRCKAGLLIPINNSRTSTTRVPSHRITATPRLRLLQSVQAMVLHTSLMAPIPNPVQGHTGNLRLPPPISNRMVVCPLLLRRLNTVTRSSTTTGLVVSKTTTVRQATMTPVHMVTATATTLSSRQTSNSVGRWIKLYEGRGGQGMIGEMRLVVISWSSCR
jgi:hypothetical protein